MSRTSLIHERKWPYYLLGLALIMILGTLHLLLPRVFIPAERFLYDNYCRASATNHGGAPVAIVEARLNPHALGRNGAGALEGLPMTLELLEERGVKVVGIMLPSFVPKGLNLPLKVKNQKISGKVYFVSPGDVNPAGSTLLPGRTYTLIRREKDKISVSVALDMASAFLGLPAPEVPKDFGGIRLGDKFIGLMKGEMLLSFSRPPQAFQHFSLSRLTSSGTAPFALENKVVLIYFKQLPYQAFSTPFSTRASAAEFLAYAVDDLIEGSSTSRPPHMVFAELLSMVVLTAVVVLLGPGLRQGSRFLLVFLCLGASVGTGYFSFTVFHVWLKAATAMAGTVGGYLVVQFVDAYGYARAREEVFGLNRLLASTFRKQGLLDMAFERLKLCPLDNETRDILYDLGLDYETRGMATQALAVYEHIQKRGPYRDLVRRISNLRSLKEIPGFDPEGARKGGGRLSDSLIKERKIVGRYQILEPLGKGTMGLVYKGMDPKLNRLVAIKIIRFSDEFDEDMIEEIKSRFFAEAAIAGRLSHPYIVTIYDVGEDLDLTYMAMEYIDGTDLSYYCDPERLLPLHMALEVTAKIASALDYAHKTGLIHRDIKPANIMITKNGNVKVTDFGIAKAVSSTRTKTGVILGTPSYMSPEQIMGHKIDFRSDIFSLGVLLYQLLTGVLPFQGQNLNSLLLQITQGAHKPARDYNPMLPRACDQILDKALAKNPKKRFGSCAEMAKYLRMLTSKVKEYQRMNGPGRQGLVGHG